MREGEGREERREGKERRKEGERQVKWRKELGEGGGRKEGRGQVKRRVKLWESAGLRHHGVMSPCSSVYCSRGAG